MISFALVRKGYSRAALGALIIAICLSGCSSDTASEAESADSPASTTSGVAEVGTTEAQSDAPTPAELRWAKKKLRWIDQMQELLGTVAAVKRVGRARMDAVEREAARQAIVGLIRCGARPGEEYEAPPSLRTALVNDTLGKACGRLNRAGLAASGHLLVDDPQSEVRDAGRLWEEESQRARDLLAAGRTEIEELQPTDQGG